MKVGELISELQKFDSEAEVGCGLSKLSGWAQKIDDVLMSEEGIVFINMGRETIGENELTLASTKVNLSKIASRIAAVEGLENPWIDISEEVKRILESKGADLEEDQRAAEQFVDLILNYADMSLGPHSSEDMAPIEAFEAGLRMKQPVYHTVDPFNPEDEHYYFEEASKDAFLRALQGEAE